MNIRLTVLLICSMILSGCGQIFETPPIATPRVITIVATPTAPIATPVPQALVAAVDAEDLLLVNLYERVNPSVVNIDIVGEFRNELTEFGSGSGFVIDDQGHIITNNHVVEDADRLYITFADGNVALAQIIGRDPNSDLAVVKVDVDAALLHPVEFGDSDQVKVGQRVAAIGNPFGLDGTMTLGIVSGVGRVLRETGSYTNPDIIQTDAPINPGNSGGPLLDTFGRVVGVNTAIRTDGENRANSGVGFAVPVNTVKRIAPQLIQNGFASYPYLGISVENFFSLAEMAVEVELPAQRGVLISEIASGGPAERAGLRGSDHIQNVRGVDVALGGDIITAIDGAPVNSFDEMIAYLLAHYQAGDTVSVTFIRDGETQTVDLVVGERPPG